MRMLDRSSRGFAVILENQNIAEPFVILQVEHSVAVRPEDVFKRSLGKRCHGRRMIRRLDNHLVRADAVHLVKKPFAFLVEIALDAKCWKLVGNDTDGPTRGVWATAVTAVNQHFVWRFRLVSRAKRAILRVLGNHTLPQEIHRPLSTLSRNDHPSAGNWVFA